MPANVHRCAHDEQGRRGGRGVQGSCSNRTTNSTDTGCQELIDRMYWACTDVCLPDGYYFDPNKMLSGCWEDNVDEMDINVERCGCNSSGRGYSVSFMVLTAVVGAALFCTIM